MQQPPQLDGVKHIILVMSGKGGVGKSSVTTQLALSLTARGKTVGVLDIDLCGPSIPRMLGLDGRGVHQSSAGWVPVFADEKKQLCCMSIGFMLENKDDSVVWRGPKKTAMIRQFLTDTCWGELDYLIVDTPPGTSDENISIVEHLKAYNPDGVVLVTTPQAVALADVRKQVSFCRQVGVPILGLIENMSGFICPHCSECNNLFSAGGGEAMSEEFALNFLGRVPIDPTLTAMDTDLVKQFPTSSLFPVFEKITDNPATEYFDACSSYVGLNLFDVTGLGGNRNKSVDHDVVNKRITGLAEKFSMKGQDAKAEALQDYLKRLRGLARSLGGGDHARTIAASSEMDREEAAQNTVSSMLLMLLELSETPTMLRRGDHGYTVPDSLKESLQKSKSQSQINKELWEAILKEDPLEVPVASRTSPEPTSPQRHSNGSQSALDAFGLWAQSGREPKMDSALRLLERQQYWRNDKAADHQHRGDTQEAREYDIQSASELNVKLREAREYSLAQEAPIMDEADVIQEVFLLLQGLPTTIFTAQEGSVTKYSTTVEVAHLSPRALQELLCPFMEIAGATVELHSLVDSICSTSSKLNGKVVQAFGAAVHAELSQLKNYMAVEQQSYQRYRKGDTCRIASLIELSTKLSSRLDMVRTLLAFVKECRFYKSLSSAREHACQNSMDILSKLYDNVCQLELLGDCRNAALFLRLLQQSIWPFLINLECWMTGQPLDSEFEFMVQAAKNVDIFSNKFWTEGCYIPTEIVEAIDGPRDDTSTVQISPRFIDGSTLDQIIPIIQHQYPMSSMRSNTDTSSQAVDYTPTIDFMWRMHQALADATKDHYLATNTQLKAMLFHQSRLLWHLRGMSEFYFMMQGEVMHAFGTSLFNKMRRRRPWRDSYVLGSTFSQVASLRDWKHAKFVKVRLKERAADKAPQTRLALDINTLDQIEFEYLLPWPLAGIVYSMENAKYMYGRITGLLMQVKTVKLAMEQMSFLKSKPGPHPELCHFWKLRLRFFSTVNDLWTYLMTTVLDTQIRRFHSDIENQTGDLDDVIQLSRRFINVCFERCFLKERTQPLHRSLMTMLNLALKFTAIFTAFIQEQAQEQERHGNAHAPTESAATLARERSTKNGRRVSFNLTRPPNLGFGRQDRDDGEDASGTESEDDPFEQELEDVAGADIEAEDIEMEAGSSQRQDQDLGQQYKKQRTGSDVSGISPREDLDFEVPLHRRPAGDPEQMHAMGAQGGYKQQLEGIEQEFNRCREFLAKSLRVVVNSNAVRGYATRGLGGGQQRSALEAQREGGSDYLHGLILALSS
ncbi:Nucleotide-binding protein 2 [Mortierella alpina]|uniref:Nucleotide-binding protein 2 n=1 Tax=Mortierella alpina TaxID=64518 RepID=A0A9P6M110_MORAP|nr:Nucleotide-binding protein 2 [Mortierella alpina]